MIKKLFFLLIGLFLIASISMAQGVADNPRVISETEADVSEPVAYVNYIEGKVLFKDFQEVELNMILQQGDEINTIDGRVEILLKDGGVIRLDSNTRVVFSALNDSMIGLEIWGGNVYVKKGSFEIGVKSPNRSLNLSQSEWYLAEPERNFKKWNNERENLEKCSCSTENYYRHWYPFLWYYYSYYPYMWQSYWYWTSWNLGWHPYWYWTRGYYYSYYPYYSYYYPSYSRYHYGGPNYYRGQTIIRKNELQRPERTPTPTLIRKSGISNTQLRSNRSIYPSRISSQEISRGISVRNFKKIYPSRITTRSIKSNSSYRSNPRVSLRSFSEPRYYSRPSISKFSSFPRSFFGPSSRSFSSFRSPSIRSGTIRRKK